MAEKISNTKVGIVSPITAYADGKEARDVASQYVKIYPANVVGVIAPSNSLYADDLDPEDAFIAENESEEESENFDANKSIRKAPTLADIELVSNTVSYDASGIPSAAIVFKVRNSSNEAIKSVNARVQII